MPSSLAQQTKARGSVLKIRPLKEDWRAVLEAWMSAKGSACNWSARMWSADISTLREWCKYKKEKNNEYDYDKRRYADALQGLGQGEPVVFSHGWPRLR